MAHRRGRSPTAADRIASKTSARYAHPVPGSSDAVEIAAMHREQNDVGAKLQVDVERDAPLMRPLTQEHAGSPTRNAPHRNPATSQAVGVERVKSRRSFKPEIRRPASTARATGRSGCRSGSEGAERERRDEKMRVPAVKDGLESRSRRTPASPTRTRQAKYWDGNRSAKDERLDSRRWRSWRRSHEAVATNDAGHHSQAEDQGQDRRRRRDSGVVSRGGPAEAGDNRTPTRRLAESRVELDVSGNRSRLGDFEKDCGRWPASGGARRSLAMRSRRARLSSCQSQQANRPTGH